MSPRTLLQYEIIREERRAQIMQVALELISEEGFANVTISKIATKAGISKGLMYNYFESKEQLILEIILEGFNELFCVFDPNKDGVLTNSEMHYFIDEVFVVIKSNIRFWRLYYMLMFQPEVYRLIEPEVQKIMQPFMKTVLGYFEKKGSADPTCEMKMFCSILDGIRMNFVMDTKNFPMESIRKKLHELYK
ncbi:MAG: TetR/AcrR family transcriptional regulator [Bacteroidales bacterium]|nr:TetR/AcrR family transcriptional regulator [Bacteroidales bacterium]